MTDELTIPELTNKQKAARAYNVLARQLFRRCFWMTGIPDDIEERLALITKQFNDMSKEELAALRADRLKPVTPQRTRYARRNKQRLKKNAMPMPTDADNYFIPVQHIGQRYEWLKPTGNNAEPWPDDYIIELRTYDNPCKAGGLTWRIFNHIILGQYVGRTFGEWRKEDYRDDDFWPKTKTLQCRARMKHFVINGWVWLRKPATT